MLQLESEHKLEISIRNSQYMAARLPQLATSSEVYSAFVNGFTRTNSFTSSTSLNQSTENAPQQQPDDSPQPTESFQLTRSYMNGQSGSYNFVLSSACDFLVGFDEMVIFSLLKKKLI